MCGDLAMNKMWTRRKSLIYKQIVVLLFTKCTVMDWTAEQSGLLWNNSMDYTCLSTRIRLKGIFVILLLTHSLPLTVHGCILLLNGWEPLSLAERTSLAPVVAAAFVRRTFRALRTDIDTFSAEVSPAGYLQRCTSCQGKKCTS